MARHVRGAMLSGRPPRNSPDPAEEAADFAAKVRAVNEKLGLETRSQAGEAGRPENRSQAGEAGRPENRSQAGEADRPKNTAQAGEADRPKNTAQAGEAGRPQNTPQAGEGPAGPKTPPAVKDQTPLKLTVVLPGYVHDALDGYCRAPGADGRPRRWTKRYAILKALAELGLDIDPADLVEDGRRRV